MSVPIDVYLELSAEQLARKKLQAGYIGATTRILGQVGPALAADPLDVSKINQLKRSLEDNLKSLSDLDEGILDLTPEDSIEAEIVHADEVREDIFAALSKLDHALSPPPVPQVELIQLHLLLRGLWIRLLWTLLPQTHWPLIHLIQMLQVPTHLPLTRLQLEELR